VQVLVADDAFAVFDLHRVLLADVDHAFVVAEAAVLAMIYRACFAILTFRLGLARI
jgi:hypothetical protein